MFYGLVPTFVSVFFNIAVDDELFAEELADGYEKAADVHISARDQALLKSKHSRIVHLTGKNVGKKLEYATDRERV